MGNSNKEKVQLVISHLEGCSGNFLGRLFADLPGCYDNFFRVDVNQHPAVLAINGYYNWNKELEKLKNHIVVVTHSFDRELIQATFPNAQLISIYPYTHIGNVLYNICFKKLTNKIDNVIDSHFIHLKEWHAHIIKRCPAYPCIDFWELTNQSSVEKLLGSSLTETQKQFFKDYWQRQLNLELDIPNTPQTVQQLIHKWNIRDQFSDWFVAWVIFVYELINNRLESQRDWSIDVEQFRCWDDVEKIQSKYNDIQFQTN